MFLYTCLMSLKVPDWTSKLLYMRMLFMCAVLLLGCDIIIFLRLFPFHCLHMYLFSMALDAENFLVTGTCFIKFWYFLAFSGHVFNYLYFFFHSSIELFQSTCNELVEWIKEKDNVLSATDDLGKDLKSNQALQRKHAVRDTTLLY